MRSLCDLQFRRETNTLSASDDRQVQRTRKPSTALPPGTMHTSGTATTLVSSSQQDSTRPSVPCGMGTRLASSASAPLACGHQQVSSECAPFVSNAHAGWPVFFSVDHAAAPCNKLQGSKAPCH